MAKSATVRTWTSEKDETDLLSYDEEKQMFNIKAGRIKPGVAQELLEALTEALAVHKQKTSPA